MKVCLFPGTFDPITNGHIDIIHRALPLFDHIVVGIGVNANKQPMFDTETRLAWIQKIFEHDSRVSAKSYTGLTTEFCKEIGANYILRGIRYVSDYEYERAIADMNKILAPNVETIFITSSPQFSTISSTLIRDVIRNGGNAKIFLPKEVDYERVFKP